MGWGRRRASARPAAAAARTASASLTQPRSSALVPAAAGGCHDLEHRRGSVRRRTKLEGPGRLQRPGGQRPIGSDSARVSAAHSPRSPRRPSPPLLWPVRGGQKGRDGFGPSPAPFLRRYQYDPPLTLGAGRRDERWPSRGPIRRERAAQTGGKGRADGLTHRGYPSRFDEFNPIRLGGREVGGRGRQRGRGSEQEKEGEEERKRGVAGCGREGDRGEGVKGEGVRGEGVRERVSAGERGGRCGVGLRAREALA